MVDESVANDSWFGVVELLTSTVARCVLVIGAMLRVVVLLLHAPSEC